MTERLASELKALGVAAGLDLVATTRADPFPSVAVDLQRRKKEGRAGRLRFTYTDARSTDPTRTLAGARSLVVGARAYVPWVGSAGPTDGRTGRIARFATDDHYRPLRSGLEAIAERLSAEGWEAIVLVDDNRLVDRAAAVRAGLAWWGKSTMAIAPRYGPWLLFGSVVTDAVLDHDEPMVRDCGSCVACIPACPTGALDVPGVLDADKCIAYWLQTAGVIPADIRMAIADRVYGCDDCLDACPPGQRLAGTNPNPDRTGRVELTHLLTASDSELLVEFGRFYIPRNDPSYLRRNALVALANVGTSADIPLAARWLASPNRDLRAHAVAALVALGCSLGDDPLRSALRDETDDVVMAEARRHVNRTGPGA